MADLLLAELTGSDIALDLIIRQASPWSKSNKVAKIQPSNQSIEMDKKEQEAREKHFEEKAKWKALPGNRYDLAQKKETPRLELVTKSLPGGLVLNWI